MMQQQTPMPTEKKAYLLSEEAVIDLNAVDGKLTDECLKGSEWRLRTFELCSLGLPVIQLKADHCSISVLDPSEPSAFVDWIASLLSVGPEVDISFMASEVIRLGYGMTLPQIELIVRATEKGLIRSGIRRDKHKNFFLMETGDASRPIKMGCFFRDEGLIEHRPWDFFPDELGRSTQWPPESRLLIRKLARSEFRS